MNEYLKLLHDPQGFTPNPQKWRHISDGRVLMPLQTVFIYSLVNAQVLSCSKHSIQTTLGCVRLDAHCFKSDEYPADIYTPNPELLPPAMVAVGLTRKTK